MSKQFAYTVRGHWPFPLDMLRHDGSGAASKEDQAKIDRMSLEYAPDRLVFEDVDINLIGPRKPNTARWESFSWAVPGDTEHQQMKGWRAREARQEELVTSALAKLTPDERAAIEATMATTV